VGGKGDREKREINMNQNKEWLTMKETQTLLDYSSRNAVYNYCKVYNVKATKPRGKVYFNHADLMAVLSGKAVKMGA
jgi:hypothetical protein